MKPTLVKYYTRSHIQTAQVHLEFDECIFNPFVGNMTSNGESYNYCVQLYTADKQVGDLKLPYSIKYDVALLY